MSDAQTPDLTKLTVDLLSAYFASNSVPSEDLANLIQSTRAALAGESSAEDVKTEEPIYTPAVSIRKSVANPDHLLSLIDGKPYKTLKRHLTSHGLTIADYKARYKLPANYPTVAPAYSEVRRETAARIGLGSRPKAAAPAKVNTLTTEAVPKLENAAVTPDAPAPTPEKAVPAKSRSSANGKAVKAKAAAKPATQAKSRAKPRAVKPNPGAETKAPAGVEGAGDAIASTAEAKPAPKETVKVAPKTAAAPAVSAVEATKAAPRPRAKLKIATPTV